jgi:hypothetical protein
MIYLSLLQSKLAGSLMDCPDSNKVYIQPIPFVLYLEKHFGAKFLPGVSICLRVVGPLCSASMDADY